MRIRLLLLLLLLPITATAQRLPLSLCAWNGTALTRVAAFYDRPANALFAFPAGDTRFDVAAAADSARGYARPTAWFRHDETVRLGDGAFASWRMTAAMDEATLELAGLRGTVPFFRRPTDRVETLYVLVGPGFRADGPMLYTPDGRCEFQPYRRVTTLSLAAPSNR